MLSDGTDREELVSWLRRDLLGPFHGPEERLSARPSSRYLVGALHPAFTPQAAEETDEQWQAVSDDDDPDATAAYGGMRQSAIGISFSTSSDARPAATVTFAEYEAVTVEDDSEEPITDGADAPAGGSTNPGKDEGARAKSHSDWQRRPVRASVEMDSPSGVHAVSDGIQVEWRSRDTGHGRVWTVSCVNRRPESGPSVFQPAIRIELAAGEFRARPPLAAIGDPDEELNTLLYRAEPDYAAGHGCAARWREGTTVTEVWTDQLPTYQIPAIVPLEETGAELRMEALGGVRDAAALREMLHPLADEYREWITSTDQELSELPDDMRKTAAINLAVCREAEGRIRAAVDLMSRDANALLAFRFMNRAMASQRIASVAAARYRASGAREKPAEIPRWRPFQLAFILLNLVGIAEPDSPDRETVDLLWFPTGGGKTEAYLGLAAFTMGFAA